MDQNGSEGTGVVAAAKSLANRMAASTLSSTDADHASVPGDNIPAEDVLSMYLGGRFNKITEHFPSALGVDDYMARVEIALHTYGFTGHNTIACCNLCRDEATFTLKDKVEAIFGSSFSTNGLGGVLSCGVIGIKAGLSHAPVSPATGKEQYVFFSFPHIGIDSTGIVGNISRPGRGGASGACGALIAACGQIREAGLEASVKKPGVHESQNPEYSILTQRLARRMQYEGTPPNTVAQMNLVDMTNVAERTITDDLEFLIKQSVDTSKADYAVVTGVQIHNWGPDFDDHSPNLEFVSPSSMYVVVDGKRTHLNLKSIPPMTPRQISLLAGNQPDEVCGSAGNITTVRGMDAPYHYTSRQHRKKLHKHASDMRSLIPTEKLQTKVASKAPWEDLLRHENAYKQEEDSSVALDESPGSFGPSGSSFRDPSLPSVGSKSSASAAGRY